MVISDFAIRRPVITVVSMLALVVFGLVALTQLHTDEFPEVQPPIVVVAVPYPGASPDNVEREIVEPIEESLAGISGVKEIQSSSLDSFATITIQFTYEKNLQEAVQDIRDKINEIRNDLPPEMEEPVLTKISLTDFPVVSLALSSDTLAIPELTLLADPGITRRLRALPGVGAVDISGAHTREMSVEIHPDALQTTGVSVSEIVAAIRIQNLAAPVGRLQGLNDERTIRLRGRVETAEDFERVIVAQRAGRVVRLGDVASVRVGVEEVRTTAVYSGQDAVGIDIKKSRGFSTTAVADAIRAEVETLTSTLPDGVVLHIVRDAGTRVKNSVANVQSALIEGALLTVLVVFVFLNSWRSTVITGLALPVSVLASFIAVMAFGFTLNTMSLLGLSLAIGILIDDAIVVRENIVRHIEMGKNHYDASREGTSEIGLAVTATTLSIIVVFVPIAFMGGEAEQWFAPFALTIACSVLVSLFVSFSLDPMLSAYWPDPHTPMAQRSFISRGLDVFNRWFDRQADRYKTVIGWALKHRLAMVTLAIGSFVFALAMPALGYLGGGFFPVQDVSEFIVQVETPPGSSLDYTKRKTEEAAALARKKTGEVQYTYTTIGSQTGAVDEGTIYVRLTPKAARARHQDEIAGALRVEYAQLGGVVASISSGRLDNRKQIQVQVRGADTRELTRIADEVITQVRQVPGAVDAGFSTRGQKPEMDIRIDRALAGTLGISVADVAQALRPAFAGVDAGDWVDPTGKTRDVTVRLSAEARQRSSDLAALPILVRDAQGGHGAIPLGQIATITSALGPARIDHLDRDRVIAIQANTQGRPLTEIIADIQKKVDAIALPAGYSITQGGETEDQQEVFSRILIALGVAVVLMYLVLVVQFGSFLDPLAIMLSLPLSLIGVVLMLMLTGDTLNIMSMIGVILLMGIVAKNAILLIDFAKMAEATGMPRQQAIIEAGRQRLRPILMTTFALIAGMVPVALGIGEGADFRAPLGRAVIGGVITSTFLTLLVIPTFYDVLSGLRNRVGRSLPVLRARGHLLAVTAALALTAGAASAQTPAASERRWEVEGFGGLSLFELPSGGTAALPPAGSPLTTSGPTNPSRRVPTWFLGDGASLLNGVNAEFGVAGRITPLDGALASLGLSGANAPAFGLRIRRRISGRLAVEVSADMLPGSRDLSPELVDAVETTRASFESAFTELLTSGPFTAVAVTATASMANRSSRELATTAALRWSPSSGRMRPYLTLGGGLVHQLGDLPSATLTGNYRFQILGTVPINETDTLRLRYEQGSALVGLVGAGVRGTLSERLGWTLDGRVLLGQQTLTLRLDSEPTVTTGTPDGFIESFTTPAIQFSNSANTGRESSLSDTPLTGFKAFSTSGLQTRFIITAGLVMKF